MHYAFIEIKICIKYKLSKYDNGILNNSAEIIGRIYERMKYSIKFRISFFFV